jgi:hypothetical protein
MDHIRDAARRAAHFVRAPQRIALDYPVRPEPRYGHGRPPHPQLERIIASGHDRYRATIEEWARLEPQFRPIGMHRGATADEPYWNNGWLPALDAAALYGFIAATKPARYVEVGSGHSTRFSRRAIRDGGLATTITSIDPHPRAEIDAICDRVIRSRLEDADLSLFNDLAAGDIVFFDGSHRVFTNSDVAVFFLDVLPRLAPGVLVQVHDIYLPFDYPPSLSARYYSEQYMLAVYLMGSLARADSIVLPNAYVTEDREFAAMIEALWNKPGLETLERYGASFWFETTA